MRPRRIKPVKINPERWYIADIRSLTSVFLLWNEFKTERKTHLVLLRLLNGRTGKYSVIQGKDAIKHKIWFFGQKHNPKQYRVWLEVTKYNYDELGGGTLAQKRNFRLVKRLRKQRIEYLEKLKIRYANNDLSHPIQG